MNCRPVSIHRWRSVKKGPHKVIIAETACQKMQGLQGTKYLPKNTILLFLNIPPNQYFHMKNCSFPIEIICLDRRNNILSIWVAHPGQQAIGPTPSETTNVLEAGLGWSSRQNLNIGDSLVFLRF